MEFNGFVYLAVIFELSKMTRQKIEALLKMLGKMVQQEMILHMQERHEAERLGQLH